jgi:BMFP domain-containing protein YqiC
MATISVEELVKGIKQAAANAYDGAKDKDGKPIKSGLEREVELKDNRTMRAIDGFTVKVCSPKQLCVTYHLQMMARHKLAALENKLEEEIEDRIKEIVAYIKKEFKNVTGSTLNLKMVGKVQYEVEAVSMVRTNLKGMCTYEISSMEDPKEEEDDLANDNEKEAEKMLAVGKDKFPGVKKPQNDTRKKEKGEDNK